MGKVRDAQGSLVENLQRKSMTNQAFQDNQAALGERPIVDSIRSLIAAGKNKEAEEAARIYESQNFLRPGSVTDLLTQSKNAIRSDEAFQFQRNQDRRAQEELNLRRQDMADRRRLEEARIELAKQQQDREYQAKNNPMSIVQAARDNLIKKSVIGGGTLDTSDGRKAFFEGLKAFNLENNAQEDITNELEARFPGGKMKIPRIDEKTNRQVKNEKGEYQYDYIPVPVQTALESVGATSEWGNGSFWSRRGDKARGVLESRLSKKDLINEIMSAVYYRDAPDAAIMDAVTKQAEAAGRPLIIPPTGAKLGGTKSPK